MNMDSLLGFGNQLFIIYSDLNSRLSRDGVLERIGKTITFYHNSATTVLLLLMPMLLMPNQITCCRSAVSSDQGTNNIRHDQDSAVASFL